MKLSGKTKIGIAVFILYLINVVAFWDNFKWWSFLFTAFLMVYIINLFDKWIDE